jgi:hypothetical protein
MNRRGDVAEADTGEGNAAKINQIHIGSRLVGGIYSFHARIVNIKENLHQKNIYFYQQQITASRSGYNVEIYIAGSD